MELGKSLAPMEPLKAKMNFITGLYNKPSTGVGIHPGMTGNILSGVPLQKGAVLKGASPWTRCWPSAWARTPCNRAWCWAASSRTRAITRPTSRWPTARISPGNTPNSPVPMEVYPSLAFDSLFENRGSRRTQSILDRVKEQAAGLSRKAGAQDRYKLDEYFTSVSEVEKRVLRLRADNGKKPDASSKQAIAAGMAAARQGAARGHARAHAADVRHRRARLSDRQDPRRLACCCAGICRACFIPSSASATPTTLPRTAT